MKETRSLPAELFAGRTLIFQLAKNDFKKKYAGSYLGIVWAFVQPVVTVMVYWFVFGMIRSSSPRDRKSTRLNSSHTDSSRMPSSP